MNTIHQFKPEHLYTKNALKQCILNTPLTGREESLYKNDHFMFNMVKEMNFRGTYTRKVAWFLLTKEVHQTLSTLIKDKHVIEVFAGSGYLKSHMHGYASYRAYDNRSHCRVNHRYARVTTKNALLAPIKKAEVIVMTWPNYDQNEAYRIARKMVSGQTLIFLGEGKGGCTANDKFFEILERDFIEQEDITENLYEEHLKFNGLHDDWRVLIKR